VELRGGGCRFGTTASAPRDPLAHDTSSTISTDLCPRYGFRGPETFPAVSRLQRSDLSRATTRPFFPSLYPVPCPLSAFLFPFPLPAFPLPVLRTPKHSEPSASRPPSHGHIPWARTTAGEGVDGSIDGCDMKVVDLLRDGSVPRRNRRVGVRGLALCPGISLASLEKAERTNVTRCTHLCS